MRLALAAFLALVGGASAQEAVVSGRVRGEPRVRAAAGGERREYVSRAGRYAKRFDHERLKDVVVYAEPAADLAPSGAPSELRIEAGRAGPRFVPGFVVAAAGAEVAVRNAASEKATLFSGEGSPEELSLVLAPGETKTLHPKSIGLFRLFMLEAPAARGKLFMAGPRFAVADASGRYRLALPAGRRRLTAWHERLPATTRELDLAPGAGQELDLVLSVKELPEVP